jgi:hypothetical protein
LGQNQRKQHELLGVSRCPLGKGIGRKEAKQRGGHKRPELIHHSPRHEEERATRSRCKQQRCKMDRTNWIERETQRRAINPENRGRLLIDPIAIGQFVMTEPPADVSVFAFIAFERNSKERQSHRYDKENQAGGDQDRLPGSWLQTGRFRLARA